MPFILHNFKFQFNNTGNQRNSQINKNTNQTNSLFQHLKFDNENFVDSQSDVLSIFKNEIDESKPIDLNSFFKKALNFKDLLSDDFNNFLVVPTYKQAENLDKELTRQYFELHKTPNPNLNIINFQKFVLRLFEELAEKDQYIFINDTLQLSLIEETLQEVIKNKNVSNLKFYKAEILLKNPENLLKLKNSISGLRKKGLTAKDLRKDYEKYNSILDDIQLKSKNKVNILNTELVAINSVNNIDKLSDFCYILEKYEEKLSGNLLDNLALVELICQKLGDLKPQIDRLNNSNAKLTFKQLKLKKFLDNSFLFFGFTHFELPDIKLLHSLKDAGFEICINFDAIKQNQNLFEIINSDIEKIMSLNSNNKFQINEININNENTTAEFIKQNLFQPNNTKISFNAPNLYNNTQIYKVKNKFSEVELISRLCKLLLSDTSLGLQPKDIVISSRNPHKYADIFREIGLKNNLNFNISDRYELKKSRLVSELISFFDILQSNFKVTKYENNIQKLKTFYYLNFDKKVINLYKINQFFENRAIVFGSSQKHIIQKLIEIRLEIINDIKNQNKLDFINPKIIGIVEGNNYTSAEKELDSVNNAILEVVAVTNYFNVFEINKSSENLDIYFIEEVDLELFNLLNEENKFTNDDKYYIKYFNYEKIFQTICSINEFENIIKNTIKKYKVLQQILNLRKLIINETFSYSNNFLNLDNIDFDEINFDEINFEDLNLSDLSLDNSENKEKKNGTTKSLENNELIKQFSYIKKNIKPNIYENLENDFKAFKNFFKSISELKNIIQIKQYHNIQFDSAENNDRFSVNNLESDKFSNYYEKLKIIISNTKYQISERQNKAIKVTSIEQTRGIDYKVNILCGLTDGEFPMPFQSDKLIGKDLENSQVIFQNNEKMQLYNYFINGAKYYKNNEKLNFIFIPKYNENSLLLDSMFVDNIIELLHKSVSNSEVNQLSNKQIKELYSKYIIELDNTINENKLNEVKKLSNEKNPFFTTWLEKLLNENINLSFNYNSVTKSNTKRNQKYQLDLAKFRQNHVQNFQIDELNILGKLFKLETKIHSISELSYLADNFYKNGESYNPNNNSEEKSIFNSKTKEFMSKFLHIDSKESISNSIVSKDKGTFFHNSIEILIKYLRFIKLNQLESNVKEIYKRDAEIELTNEVINALKVNLNEIINETSQDDASNKEIQIKSENPEILNTKTNKSTLFHINENLNSLVNELNNNNVTKSNLLEFVHSCINAQLLKKFPKNIYLNYISELYLDSTKQFLEFVTEYSTIGRNILFSELELKMIDESFEVKLENILKDPQNKYIEGANIKNDTFNINNVKLKYTGRADLIYYNEFLGEKFFEIVDMKFSTKKSKKENMQLYFYFIALNKLLTKSSQIANNNLFAKETTHIYLEHSTTEKDKFTNFIEYFNQKQHITNEKNIAKNLKSKKPISPEDFIVSPFIDMNIVKFIEDNETYLSTAMSNLIFKNVELKHNT